MLSVFTRYMSSTPVRSSITKTLKPVLFVKTKDVINYFKKPEVLQEIPTVHYIRKDEIINVTKDFKKINESTSKEFTDLEHRKPRDKYKPVGLMYSIVMSLMSNL